MIKGYDRLEDFEKEKILECLNIKENITLKEMDLRYKDEIYDFSKNVFINFKDTPKVILNCITKEIEKLKTGYIIIDSVFTDKKEEIDETINYAEKFIENLGAVKVLICFREKDKGILESLGFKYTYSSYTMELIDNDLKALELLNLEELNEKNKKEFIKIYNSAFNDMPHGCTLSEEECLKLLKEKDRNFIVKEGRESVGFLTLDIEKENGKFDIGLDRNYRNRGLSKKLLETAIVNLKIRGVQNISLIVIEKNEVAFKIYKKRGFKIKDAIGYWIEKPLLIDEVLKEDMAKEACTWKYRGKYKVYNMSYREALMKKYSIGIKESREKEFIGYKLKDNLIGYGRIREYNNECYIGIGIKPSLCGKGYGKIIMDDLITKAKERYKDKEIVVEVRDFNKRAIKCYEKLGFRIIDVYEIIRGERITFYKMKLIN
ncbi:MAG: GNAT family N-acetyltransferase [Clostridium chrysemydis]|uniref:GNAT family N-acetyltransferase n=1 Tax=Clostridium chrysemydis TaxID=2665504 RepID=UPI003F3062D3